MHRTPGYLLITGAGRGIGAAIARQAAEAGWDVALNYQRDAAAARRVAESVRERGRQALLLQADVANEAEVLAAFEQLDRAGQLAGLVNNAGIVDAAMPLAAMDEARWQRMFGVNVFGSMRCAREAVRRMSTRLGGQGGVIVNMSSAAARLGSAGQYVDYAASKAAIDTFTLGLAREVATEGIRVNAVRPGIIATEIHASSGQPGRVHEAAAQIPLQRVGTADEVAAAVVWLLSPAASYVTGTILDVTGGR